MGFSTGFAARGAAGVSTAGGRGVLGGFVSTSTDFAGVLLAGFSRSAGFGAGAGVAGGCFAGLAERTLFAVFANAGFVSTCTSAADFASVFVGIGVAGAGGVFFTGLSGFASGFCFASCVVVTGCVTACGTAVFSATGLRVAGFGVSLLSVGFGVSLRSADFGVSLLSVGFGVSLRSADFGVSLLSADFGVSLRSAGFGVSLRSAGFGGSLRSAGC